uniref:DNA-binding protein RHL1 n=1 Tax=Dunaliella tertiolecta TaxID=3047 RepID=A0A7S3QK99_DUNTE
MPPRKEKGTDEEKDNRLRERAVKQGILAESQPAAPDVPLPLSKALLKSNGQDILKKSTTRKNRYLLILNCLLAPATAGKLGSLANLDSQEPCMYIDFPNGRLKLFGTLVFPRNKYLLLRIGGQQGVMCEDVFENMIVFSESWWVGTAEENPEERQLPLPAELSTNTIHCDYDFAYGASFTGGGKAGKIAGSQQDPPSQQGLGSQQVVMSQQGPSQEPPGSALRPRRAAAQKSYQGLASENEDDDIEMDEEDEEGEEGRGQGRPIAGAARAIRPLQHDPIEILSTEDPDEAKEQGRDRQGGRGSLDLEADEVKRPNPRKRAAAPKRTLKDASSDAEDDDGDEDDEDAHGSEEDGSLFDGSEDEQPRRSKPAARKPAAGAGRARKQPAGAPRGTQSPTAKRQRADPASMPRSTQKAPQRKRGKAKSNASGAKEDSIDDGDDDDVAGRRLDSDEQAGQSDDEDGEGREGVLTAAEKGAAAAAAASGPRPARSPRRAAAKRITYAESDDEEGEEVEDEEAEGDYGGDSDADSGSSGAGDDGDSEDGGRRRRKRPAASQGRGRGGAAARRAAPRKKAKQASPEVFEINSDDD